MSGGVFYNDGRLRELLAAAGVSTNDRVDRPLQRGTLLKRCLKAGKITAADAAARPKFYKQDELEKLIRAAGLPLPARKDNEAPRVTLVRACLEHRLITKDEADATAQRTHAPKAPAEERAKWTAREGDLRYVSVRNSLARLLKDAAVGPRCKKGRYWRERPVRGAHGPKATVVLDAVEDAVRRVGVLTHHAYQLVKLQWLRTAAMAGANAILPLPDQKAYLAALQAVSAEGVDAGRSADAAQAAANGAAAAAFADGYKPTLPEGYALPSRDRLNKVLVWAAGDMAKNARNNVFMHFCNRVRRWVNVRFGVRERVAELRQALAGQAKEEVERRVRELRAAFHAVKDDLLLERPPQCAQEHVAWVLEERLQLLPGGGAGLLQGAVACDVVARPEAYVGATIRLCTRVESAGGKVKGFNALPQKSGWAPGAIVVDTTVLQDLVGGRLEGVPRRLQRGELLTRARKDAIWEAAGFRIGTRCFRKGPRHAERHVFHHQVTTDGVSASALLVRTDLRDARGRGDGEDDDDGGKNESRKQRLKRAKMERAGLKGAEAGAGEAYIGPEHAALAKGGKGIVTNDPGVKDLFCCGCPDREAAAVAAQAPAPEGPPAFKFLRYTQAQRKRESREARHDLIRHAHKIAEGQVHQGLGVEAVEAALGDHSSKTADPERYRGWLAASNGVAEALHGFYARPDFRRLRWNAWANRRRSEDRFMRRFAKTFGPPNKVLVACGDWSANTALRGWQPTIKGASQRRIMRRHGYQVVLNRERNTTKCCSACEVGEARTFKTAPDPRGGKHAGKQWTVHGLLRCGSCGELHNRNKNAVRNQHRAALAALNGQERPRGL